MQKLTIREIEEKINQFQDRIKALEEVIKDVKDPNAKKTLRTHVISYNSTVTELRAELTRRLKH